MVSVGLAYPTRVVSNLSPLGQAVGGINDSRTQDLTVEKGTIHTKRHSGEDPIKIGQVMCLITILFESNTNWFSFAFLAPANRTVAYALIHRQLQLLPRLLSRPLQEAVVRHVVQIKYALHRAPPYCHVQRIYSSMIPNYGRRRMWSYAIRQRHQATHILIPCPCPNMVAILHRSQSFCPMSVCPLVDSIGESAVG